MTEAAEEKRARKEARRQERWAAKQAFRYEKSATGFDSKRGLGIGGFLILGIVALFLLGSRGNHDGNPSAAVNSDIDPENTLHDLTRDRKFLAENPDFLDITRRLIAARGYECQRVNIMWVKGPSPFGPKFEIFCGPTRGTGIYEALHYAVYPDQFRVDVCKQNGVFSNGCE